MLYEVITTKKIEIKETKNATAAAINESIFFSSAPYSAVHEDTLSQRKFKPRGAGIRYNVSRIGRCAGGRPFSCNA